MCWCFRGHSASSWSKKKAARREYGTLVSYDFVNKSDIDASVAKSQVPYPHATDCPKPCAQVLLLGGCSRGDAAGRARGKAHRGAALFFREAGDIFRTLWIISKVYTWSRAKCRARQGEEMSFASERCMPLL
jgi:hypothetical protein